MYDTFFIFLNSFFHALISTSLIFFVIFAFGFLYFYVPIKFIFAASESAAKESLGKFKNMFRIKTCGTYVLLFCSLLLMQTAQNFITGMHL